MIQVASRAALDRARQQAVLLLQASVHLVPDRLRLARVAARAHDEEVGVRADGPHVEDDDVARELVLDERRDPACLFDRRQAAPVYRGSEGGYSGSRARSIRNRRRHVAGHVLPCCQPGSEVARGDGDRLDLEEGDALGVLELARARASSRSRGKPGRVATARRDALSTSSGSFQARKSQNSSAPIRKTGSRHSGWARSVSTVRACVVEHDLVVRERRAGEPQAHVGGRRRRACGRGRPTTRTTSAVEPELLLRAARELDVAAVRRVERAAVEADQPLPRG